MVMVLWTIMTPLICPKVRVSVSKTQGNTPEDLHLTSKEGGAEKDCYRGCYELYYGWEHAPWPLPRAADQAALSCGTAPTNGKRDRHGHLSNGTGRGNHENLPRPSLYVVVSPVAFG
jgi:hypothetical protein